MNDLIDHFARAVETARRARTAEPTVADAATHSVWWCEPCDCDATDDHDSGQEVRS